MVGSSIARARLSGFRRRGWAVLAALLVVAAVSIIRPAQADPLNLVQNGDFTATSVTGAGGYLCVNSGSSCSSQLTDWSATCSSGGCSGNLSPSSILIGNASAFNSAYPSPGLYWSGSITPPSGGNAVAIDGDPKYTSVLSQVVTGLTVGQTYELQFYQASSMEQSFSGATTEQWAVSLGGTTQDSTLMNTASQSSTPWTQQTLTFVASAVTETLQFASLGTPAGEPPVALLGDVDLFVASQSTQSVPEPVSAALLGAGLLGVVVARRRVRQ
jgi:hypothetical protein